MFDGGPVEASFNEASTVFTAYYAVHSMNLIRRILMGDLLFPVYSLPSCSSDSVSSRAKNFNNNHNEARGP